ncbi:MAG: DEAD/DEAH box helicase family protein [bacterium]|nr:DEAD/DEAH box helicase family protein [bacterium]
MTPPPPPGSHRDVITLLKERGPDKPQLRGQLFERLIAEALQKHPGEYGETRFEKVWRWSEWPDRRKRGFGPDCGIDLVAEQSDDFGGGLCAIQCKAYEDTSTVPTSAVDSFLAESGTDDFSARLLVATGGLTDNAWRKIEKATPRCEVLDRSTINGWDVRWEDFLDRPGALEFNAKRYAPRPYQHDAVRAVVEGLNNSDSRGQMVLPCGTGKSVVALWIAEKLAGKGGRVLCVVPSIALMGQTMREWAAQKSLRHRYLGVCSDPTSGRRSAKKADLADDLTELAMPVTTDSARLRPELDRLADPEVMAVVFCTYQSLPKVAENQEQGAAEFDLIICDEAHRTTGVESAKFEQNTGEDKSGFRMVHDNNHVRGHRRLYMTATPRVFTEKAKQKAEANEVDSFSMDDETVYGPVLYNMEFAEAVDSGWLSDYEVVVIAVSDRDLRRTYESDSEISHADTGLAFDDYVKLAGCWDALADPLTVSAGGNRHTGQIDMANDTHARTAIAFTNRVKASQLTAEMWPKVVENVGEEDRGREYLQLDVQHVDGSTAAVTRHMHISALRDHRSDPNADPRLCRVVTNARVLTEGVDVPALDAVIFLDRRTSKIDITQAVGRAMRTAPGKRRGYVVIPVVVADDETISSESVLNGSDFKVVWDVVRALRSHDERVNFWVNNVEVAKQKAPIRVLDRTKSTSPPEADDETETSTGVGEAVQLQMALDDKIASKLVDVCGDRQMWPHWGKMAADVCVKVQRRVQAVLLEFPELATAFDRFTTSMRRTVGPQITDADAQEMVAQHVVTIPVFDAFFERSQFATQNPVSQQINRLLDEFAAKNIAFEHERRPLTRAYARMADAFEGALTGAQKLDVLREVYDGFFQAAMAATVKRLGIVYTPVELVDFVLRSVDAVCRQEFGKGLTAEDVHVLDPFTGTGTFINRLLTLKGANGEYLIRSDDLLRKYTTELHANEIVLLAYYIAALKIEEAADERGAFDGVHGYTPFEGIVLTDTFLMDDEKMHQQLGLDQYMAENSDRAKRQNKAPIQVIVGNPPWSAGQKSAGDDNPNLEYGHIEERVRDTYGKRHKQITGRGAGKSSGNLYVEAIRWASDRLANAVSQQDSGKVLAFIHPNSLSNGTSLAGMRASLRDEFTDIYVVNLLGDAMKSGDEFRREGDKIFGAGSRNGVQITVLVRNPEKDPNEPATLHYATVPEYSKLPQKLDWLATLDNVTSDQFQTVPINQGHDWVNLTDGTFSELVSVCAIGSRGRREDTAIKDHALGLATNCDVYVYSFSRQELIRRVEQLIDSYEEARMLYELGESLADVTENVELDSIKWTDTLKQSLRKNEEIVFDESRIREVLYRPFTKLWLYEDPRILSSVKTVSAMFPRERERERENTILIASPNNRAIFGAIASNCPMDLSANGTNQPTRAVPRRRQS